jgi:hypothetical protein
MGPGQAVVLQAVAQVLDSLMPFFAFNHHCGNWSCLLAALDSVADCLVLVEFRSVQKMKLGFSKLG